MDDVELEHLDGVRTWDLLQEIQRVYAAAFPGYSLEDHERRTRRQTGASGFEAVTARLGGELIGMVYGLPLAPGSAWWDGLDPAAPDDFTIETGSRTFAVIDLAVVPEHRGQGLGRRLMDELLRHRPEERATLATNPARTSLQQMYERWDRDGM